MDEQDEVTQKLGQILCPKVRDQREIKRSGSSWRFNLRPPHSAVYRGGASADQRDVRGLGVAHRVFSKGCGLVATLLGRESHRIGFLAKLLHREGRIEHNWQSSSKESAPLLPSCRFVWQRYPGCARHPRRAEPPFSVRQRRLRSFAPPSGETAEKAGQRGENRPICDFGQIDRNRYGEKQQSAGKASACLDVAMRFLRFRSYSESGN